MHPWYVVKTLAGSRERIDSSTRLNPFRDDCAIPQTERTSESPFPPSLPGKRRGTLVSTHRYRPRGLSRSKQLTNLCGSRSYRRNLLLPLPLLLRLAKAMHLWYASIYRPPRRMHCHLPKCDQFPTYDCVGRGVGAGNMMQAAATSASVSRSTLGKRAVSVVWTSRWSCLFSWLHSGRGNLS